MNPWQMVPPLNRTRLMAVLLFGCLPLSLLAQVHHFDWSSVPAQVAPDTPFPVTITARDAAGNVFPDFAGSVALRFLAPGPGPSVAPNTVSFGQGTDEDQNRFQCIYLPSEVGGAGRLVALDLNFSVPPASLSKLSVRLKHTARTDYSGGDQVWEADGWTLVYLGSPKLGEGVMSLPFTTPFDYDGTSNLLVDLIITLPADAFRFGSAFTYRANSTNPSRTIYNLSESFSDALTWAGISPIALSTDRQPNVRFWSLTQASLIRPASAANFAGGAWNGNISLPFDVSSTRLEAEDAQGHRGASNYFQVKKAPIPPGGGIVFREDFESALLAGSWKFTGTISNSPASFHTVVTSANGPHGGFAHLTMDSAGGSFSPAQRNEATLTLDLQGLSGLSLSFWARGFLETPDGPPPIPFTGSANFDGVAISADGTTWYEVQGLRSLANSWTLFAVDLDKAIRTHGLSYTSTFKIRFNQYGVNRIPSGGIAIDDIAIASVPGPFSFQVLAPAQMAENGGATTASVTLPFLAATSVTVTLTTDAPAKIAIPAQVTIPAGQTSASFPVQPLNDLLMDGNKVVGIIASSPHFAASGTTVAILDDELPAFSLNVPVNVVAEGDSPAMATVSIPVPAGAPMSLQIVSSDPSEISVPTIITMPVGATSVDFPLTIVNDLLLDGPQSATITVSAIGGLKRSSLITVNDNESSNLLIRSSSETAITLPEHTGDRTITVYLPAPMPTATTVSFSSSSALKIPAPSAVIIPAGSIGANLSITISNNTVADEDETVVITASAPGFSNAAFNVTVLDDDPHHFTISPIGNSQVKGAAIPVTVTAVNAGGAPVTVFAGSPNLTASSGATALPTQPGKLYGFASGVWMGEVQINAVANGVVLTVSDGAGHSGVSNPFDLNSGPFQSFVWDPIPVSQFTGSPIPVTVRAADAGGNPSSFNGPISVRALAAIPSITIGSGKSNVGNYLNANALQARAQILYLASELGPAATLGGIALELRDDINFKLENFTIRIKKTNRTVLDGANGWDGDGFKVVHQSTYQAQEAGWQTFLFDEPFEFDGQSNLLVDISFSNAKSANIAPTWLGTTGTARLYTNASSSNGNPLLWAGTSVGGLLGNVIPNARFLTLQPIPANIPANPIMVAGTWSGAPSFAGNLDHVFFEATDGSNRHGVSKAFRVGTGWVVATLPFQEGFEAPSLSHVWTTSGDTFSRPRLTSSHGPHSGAQQVVLDGRYISHAYLTLAVDLAGYSAPNLAFWAKRFRSGSEGSVSVSADGITWQEVQGLRYPMPVNQWTQYTIDLSAFNASSNNSDFKIRFSQNVEGFAPIRGIVFDDISVTGTPSSRPILTVPASITENGPAASCTVALLAAPASDTVVALSSSNPNILGIPASVIIPAGQTSASFSLTPADNSALQGPLLVAVSASVTGKFPATAGVQILDDETATLSLSVPSPIEESDTPVLATLTLSAPPVASLAVALTSNLGLLQFPSTVTFQPGESTITFPVTNTDTNVASGSLAGTITAIVAGWPSASAPVVIEDNEGFELELYAFTPSVVEGSTVSVTMQLSGFFSEDLVVSLTSSDPARATVPSTITFEKGYNGSSFMVTAIANSTPDGNKPITITASAPGWASASAVVTVVDNDPHHFSISPISPNRVRGAPFPVTVTARDQNENKVTSFVGTANFSMSGIPAAITFSPANSTAFVAGEWTGFVTVDTFATNAQLSVSDGLGHSGSSNFFTVGVGTAHHFGWITPASPQVVGIPFNATLTALDAGNNASPNYEGYAVLSAPPITERFIGSGTLATSTLPIAVSFHDQRTQAVYLASEVGGAGLLASLSLYVTGPPSLTLNKWTIRMKYTLQSTVSSWDTSGWTTVHQSNATIMQTGWVTFSFSTPFLYNGTDNLLLDLSFNNTTASFGGAVRAFSVTPERLITGRSNSEAGDPLLWSQSSPTPVAYPFLPQIKLNAPLPGIPVAPGAVFLSQGSWTGNITAMAPSPYTSILATGITGVAGMSNLITVQSSPDSDADGLPDTWENARGLSSANGTGDHGALGDFDHDGILNLLEYALNLNPTVSDVSGLPYSERRTNPADGKPYLEFTYRRRIGSPGLTYAPQASHDLAAWSSNPSNFELVGTSTAGDGITEYVTVRLLPSINTPGLHPRFVRLGVTAP